MRFRPTGVRHAAIGFLLLTIFASAKANGQAPPGPLPQAPSQDAPGVRRAKAPGGNVPRTKSLAGSWRLNSEESDDPRKKLQQTHESGGQRGARRGGWPGGMGGGRGGYGGRGAGAQSDSERQKMQPFVEPAQQLSIVQKEPEIEIADEMDRKFTAYTDGRKVAKSKDPGQQQFDARWDEYRLVMEGQDPQGHKYERSYEVLEGNQQLRETLLLKLGRNNTAILIQYVYDAASQAKP